MPGLPASRRFLLGFGLLLALAFASCSFVLEITLVDPSHDPPTFQLRKPASFFVGSTTPEMRQITVLATAPGSEGSTPLWLVFSADGTKLRQITYGVLPEGFEQDAPALPLVPGRSYTLQGQAWGGSGQLDFELRTEPLSDLSQSPD